VQTVHLSCSVQSVLIISSADRSSVLFSPVRHHYQQCRPFICPVQSSPSSLSAVQTVHLSCSVRPHQQYRPFISPLQSSPTSLSAVLTVHVLFSPVRPHYQQCRPFICPVQSSPSSLSAVQAVHLSCSVQSVLISSTGRSSVLFSPVRPHYQQCRPFICPVQSSPSSLSAVQTIHLSCSVQHRQNISSTAKVTYLV